jgi:hypothetical protein
MMTNRNLGQQFHQFEHARVPPSLYSYGQPKESTHNVPETTYSAGETKKPTVPSKTYTEKSIETTTDDIRMSHYKHMLEM